MTIGNALSFIKRGMTDPDLRNRLNGASTPAEIQDILVREKVAFSDHDFDEAFHHQLTLCQSAEEADRLREFKTWWNLLTQLMQPAACQGGCSGCSG